MICSSIKKKEFYNTLINAFLIIIYLKVNINLNLLFKEKTVKTCKKKHRYLKAFYYWDPPLLSAGVLWRRAVSEFTIPASSPRESLFTDDIDRFIYPSTDLVRWGFILVRTLNCRHGGRGSKNGLGKNCCDCHRRKWTSQKCIRL